MVRIEIN